MRHIETIFEQQQYDGDDWPPNGALGFVKWFNEKLERIPAEFRDSAHVDLDTTRSYGDDYVTLRIYYYRPETDEEYVARVAERLRRLEEKKQQELATLAALQAKYATP